MSLNEYNITELLKEYIKDKNSNNIVIAEFYAYINDKNMDNNFLPLTNIDNIQLYFGEIKENIYMISYDPEAIYEKNKFKISDSNNLRICINEKYKIDIFILEECKNSYLSFGLENFQGNFIHKNIFLFKRCTFEEINIIGPVANEGKFSFDCSLTFDGCMIKKMDTIQNKEFNNSLTFNNTTFTESINLDNKIFNADLQFENCVFIKDINFNKSMFNCNISFIKCQFKENIKFQRAKFVKEAHFVNSKFNRIDFLAAEFKDNVYFNQSIFNGTFILESSQFNKGAHFLNVEFKNVFSLESCLFKALELINFTSLKIDANIKTLEININKALKQKIKEEKIKREIKKEEKIKSAETLRNSFATIKHNFIQRNNLIEAQKYKIAEFYAEELRFKYECEIIKKGCLDSLHTFPKATINFIQLLFYRHTSNHHTDLLKSIHTMLLLITLFAVFNYLIVSVFNCCCLDVFVFDMQTYIAIINNFIATNKCCLIFINLLIIAAFLLSFLGLLYLKYLNNTINETIVFLSYAGSFLLLVISPKSIISITNLFSGNQHILDPLSALSGIYTILFILLIYSLQKTSRRNSIM